MSVRIHTHTRIYICIHIQICTCVGVYICVCTRLTLFMFANNCLRICLCTCIENVHYMYACVRLPPVYVSTRLCIWIWICATICKQILRNFPVNLRHRKSFVFHFSPHNKNTIQTSIAELRTTSGITLAPYIYASMCVWF